MYLTYISFNSSDEHTPVEEDVKNSSSESSSEGKVFISVTKSIKNTMFFNVNFNFKKK